MDRSFLSGLLVSAILLTPEGRTALNQVAKTGATVSKKYMKFKYNIDLADLFSDDKPIKKESEETL